MLCTQYRYIQCYVKRLCYVHNIDIFNAMLKGSKVLKEAQNTLSGL